jgi:hypothetical protein
VRATQIPCSYSSCQPTCIGIKPSHRNLWGTEGILLARHMAWLYIIIWFDKTFHLLLYAVPEVPFYQLEQAMSLRDWQRMWIYQWKGLMESVMRNLLQVNVCVRTYWSGFEMEYVNVKGNQLLLSTLPSVCVCGCVCLSVCKSVRACEFVCAVEPHTLRAEPLGFWPRFVLTTRRIFLAPESENSDNFTNKVGVLVDVFIAAVYRPLH